MNNRTQRNWLAAALCLGLLAPHHPPHGHSRGPQPARLSTVQLPRLDLRQDNGWSKSVEVAPETCVHQGPRPLQAGDLRVGMRVHERDRWNGRVYLAEDIDVLPGTRAQGEVVRSGPGQLCLRQRDGSLVWVELARQARVHSRFFPCSLDSGQPGEPVVVEGESNGNAHLLASEVDFPERFHPLLWLALPAGLALLGWGRRYGRAG